MTMGSMAGDDVSVFSDYTQGSGSVDRERIFVAVRLRPLNEKEIERKDVSDWECISTNTIVFKNNVPERSLVPTAYTFDRVFGPECNTKQVYEDAAKEIALSAISGINSSIFAYGQTSSGKTYTMIGITQCAVADIYDYIEKHPEREFVLKFSALEIYNEAVRDLLSSDATPLRLLDDPEKGTVVDKVTEETLRDQSHLTELLAVCEAQRQVGETSLNETSSRSHQILRLSIESSAREYLGAGNSATLTAYVDFVDLAGSERASQTLSTGARLKEGSHINRSLLTLGTVIRKLSKGRNSHIPYRDSKLTRILQNSLGGNARTSIICTMSPAHAHVEQSKNTLFFANCAKEVTTNAQVNIVMSEKALVKQLQRELARMESELKSLESASAKRNNSTVLREKEALIEKMENEIKELTQQRDIAQSRVENLLRTTEENGLPKLDELPVSGSSNLDHNLPRSFGPRIHNRVDSIDDQHLQLTDGIEDDFLLDDAAPRFSGPDPCQGWEEIAREYREHPEDACKEVRCVEVQETTMNRKVNEDAFFKEGNSILLKEAASLQDEVRELNHTDEDQNPTALRQEVQEPQKAIGYLIKHYPVNQSSLSEPDKTGSVQLRISKSKSGRPMMAIPFTSEQEVPGPENLKVSKSTSGRSLLTIPSSWVEKTLPDAYDKEFTNNGTGKLSRKNSQSSVESDVTQMSRMIDDDDKTSVLNFVVRPNDMPKQLSNKYLSGDLGAFSPDTNWYLQFERQRKQIIELWDACYVPLVHRSCFFLLFKGDPSDSVYMEVELRRLSFLKNTFSQGTNSMRDSPSPSPASSMKALHREREMLSKRVHRIFTRKEREILYQKWGISLGTKQRSRQLSQRVWTDTRDMYPIRESAKLVARLVGFKEQDQAPKEIFGLSFSPRTISGRPRESFGLSFAGRRSPSSRSNLSFRWRSNMSTIS